MHKLVAIVLTQLFAHPIIVAVRRGTEILLANRKRHYAWQSRDVHHTGRFCGSG